jgi:hypothetical protein
MRTFSTARDSGAARRGAVVAAVVALLGASFAVWMTPAHANPDPVLSIGDAAVVEGNTGKRQATLPITLSEPLAEDLFFDITMVDVTATGGAKPTDPGVDYKSKSNTLKIAAGKTFRKLNVVVFDDVEPEADETMQVVVSAPSNPSVTIGRSTGTVTIIDDDPPPASPTLSIGDAAVVEGNTGKRQATLPITLSEPLAEDLFFDITMVDVTATGGAKQIEGVDYKSKSNTLKLRAGKTFRKLNVVVFDDVEPEADETMQVLVSSPSNPAVSLGRSTGTVTIIDDDDDSTTVPDAPTNVVATLDSTNPSNVDVEWTAPNSGGSAITSYSIEVTTDAGANWSPAGSVGGSTTSANVSCGVPVVTCQYRVAATNAVGTGPASDPSNAVVTPDFPGAPTNVVAALGAEPDEIDLSWTAPLDDGGSPIVSYLIEYTNNGGATWTPWGSLASTSGTLCCFAPSTTFQFRVYAETLVGLSGPSDPSNEVTTPDLPSAPTNVVASLGDAANEIDLTWTAAGGDPIFYFIEYTDDDGTTWEGIDVTGGDVTQMTLCCFAPATSYRFRVTAYTAFGFGAPSDPSNEVTTPGFTAPGSPTNVVASLDEQAPGAALVEWSSPASDGGAPILAFSIEVTTNAGAMWTPWDSVSGLVTEATVPCGAPGTTCQFRVSAVNSAGTSAPSAPSNPVMIPI